MIQWIGLWSQNVSQNAGSPTQVHPLCILSPFVLCIKSTLQPTLPEFPQGGSTEATLVFLVLILYVVVSHKEVLLVEFNFLIPFCWILSHFLKSVYPNVIDLMFSTFTNIHFSLFQNTFICRSILTILDISMYLNLEDKKVFIFFHGLFNI